MAYFPNEISDFKRSVRSASTGSLTLASPGSTIDGVTMASGDRVLVKNQATLSENGLYVWNGAATPMTRTRDADDTEELTAGTIVNVEEGTENADTTWIVDTDGPISIGVDGITFTEISGSGGTLTELDDVDTTGVVDGSLLRYESGTGEWLVTTAASTILADDGTLNITTTGSNPAARIVQGLTGGTILTSRVSGDTQDRFRIGSTGDLQWQRGSDGANDGSIAYNATTGRITLTSAGDFHYNDAIWMDAGSSVRISNNSAGGFIHDGADVATRITFQSELTGDTAGRWNVLGDGRMNFGSGSATPDFEMAWSEANVLAVGSGDRIQQEELPATEDDLSNQAFVERMTVFLS